MVCADRCTRLQHAEQLLGGAARGVHARAHGGRQLAIGPDLRVRLRVHRLQRPLLPLALPRQPNISAVKAAGKASSTLPQTQVLIWDGPEPAHQLL